MKPKLSDFLSAAGLQVYTCKNRQHVYSMLIYIAKSRKLWTIPVGLVVLSNWFVDMDNQYE